MKKVFAVGVVALLAGALAFAQDPGTKPHQKQPSKKVKHDPKAPNNEKIGTTGNKVKLNPQPEPPGVQNTKIANPGNKVSINPQPLPPRTTKTSAGDKVSLNPQPLPPKTRTTSASDKVSLNPQPLPPKVGKSSVSDKVSLNPQPLPPGGKSSGPKGTTTIQKRIPTNPAPKKKADAGSGSPK
jgi:hypothetical protein